MESKSNSEANTTSITHTILASIHNNLVHFWVHYYVPTKNMLYRYYKEQLFQSIYDANG